MQRLAGLLAGVAACGGGNGFESAREFDRAQQEAGFVRIAGCGSVSWPATVVGERTQPDEISLRAPDGTPHRYRGYDGYTLKVVRLRGKNGQETVVVYRSREKG